MYVYIYIFSDLLRKRDSFLRVFNLKKGSIRSYKAGDRKDDFAALLIDTRVGRAAGHVKADFCYDRLMGRTNGCRCSQRGENR